MIAALHNPYIAKSSSSVYRLGLLNAKIADKEQRLDYHRQQLQLTKEEIPKAEKALELAEFKSQMFPDEFSPLEEERCREDLARMIADVPQLQGIVRQYAEMVPTLQEERQALIVHLNATRGA